MMLTVVGTVLNYISLNSCFWYSMVTAVLLSKARDEPEMGAGNAAEDCMKHIHQVSNPEYMPKFLANLFSSST